MQEKRKKTMQINRLRGAKSENPTIAIFEAKSALKWLNHGLFWHNSFQQSIKNKKHYSFKKKAPSSRSGKIPCTGRKAPSHILMQNLFGLAVALAMSYFGFNLRVLQEHFLRNPLPAGFLPCFPIDLRAFWSVTGLGKNPFRGFSFLLPLVRHSFCELVPLLLFQWRGAFSLRKP